MQKTINFSVGFMLLRYNIIISTVRISMKTISFDIEIKASKEKVWSILWQDSNYRAWTKVFCEGSHAVSDWKEGSRILFLNGEGQSMYSVIEKKRPNEFMLFRHLGEIDNGKEQPPYQQSSTESYILTESDGKTHLTVELLVEEEYEDYFFNQFPVALKKIKMLAE